MSYEGHEKILCRNGHLSVFDAYDDINPSTFSCRCGAVCVWWTAVDTTNGDDEETGRCPGDVDLEIEMPADYDTCNLGHSHTVREATYKIPPSNIGHHVTVKST